MRRTEPPEWCRRSPVRHAAESSAAPADSHPIAAAENRGPAFFWLSIAIHIPATPARNLPLATTATTGRNGHRHNWDLTAEPGHNRPPRHPVAEIAGVYRPDCCVALPATRQDRLPADRQRRPRAICPGR